MFQQLYEPAGNLAVSTLIAAIPIIVLFVLLAGIRMAAQWASLITLVIAVLVYQMPLGLALNSTLLGICFGLFPIVWIVINATFLKYKQPSPQRSRLPQPHRSAPQLLSVEASCIFDVAPAA